jgi:DNA-binding transcriptional ArsR family regulator
MSRTAIAWALQQRLSPFPRSVLVQLADHLNQDTGRCYPSVPTLARECVMSVRAVRAQLRALEKAGLIQTIERPGSWSKYVLRVEARATAEVIPLRPILAPVSEPTPAADAGVKSATPAYDDTEPPPTPAAASAEPLESKKDNQGRKEARVAPAAHARDPLPIVSNFSQPQQARRSGAEDMAQTIEVAIGVSIEPSPVVEEVQAAPVVGQVAEVAAGPIVVRDRVEGGKEARGSGRKAPLADDWFPNPAQIALALRMGAIDVDDEVRRYRIRHERDDTRADAAGWTRWWASWCDKIGRYGKAPARRAGDLSWLRGAMGRYADPGGPIIEGAVA